MPNLLLFVPMLVGFASANPETTFVLPGGPTIEMMWIPPGTFSMGSSRIGARLVRQDLQP